MTDKLLFGEAVAYLNCSPEWLMTRRDSGLIPYEFDSEQKYRFDPSDLDRVRHLIPRREHVPKTYQKSRKTQKGMLLAEIKEEAAALGMNVDEYLEQVYCDF